jgi:excisionase family DNA binding protein
MSISSLALLAGASNSAPGRVLYSPKEIEGILSVSHATCYRLIAAGKLDARKLGGKRLITAESIERLVTELPKVGTARLTRPRFGSPGASRWRARGHVCLRGSRRAG